METAPLVHVPGNPMPAGGQAGWIAGPDGARMRYAVWEPGAAGIETPRGTVLLAGGRGEFIEKYFEVAGELIRRGFAVATLDWRGQGLSARGTDDPHKGHIDDFDEFEADLAHFMAEIVLARLPRPVLALAHSMGGHIVLRAAHTHAHWFQAIALSAPMLGLKLGGWASVLAARLLAEGAWAAGQARAFVPGGRASHPLQISFEENFLTADRVRHDRQIALLKAEPALGLGGPTFGWVRAALRSIRRIDRPGYLEGVVQPVLIGAAECDVLIDNQALRRAAHRLAQSELLLVAGAGHEILMETDERRAIFWEGFDGLVARSL